MRSSLQVIVRLVEVLLLYLYLCYLVQRRALQILVIRQPYHLLKVKNGIVVVVHFLKCLGFVEVRLTNGYVTLRHLTLCEIAQLVKVLQSLFVVFHLKVEDTSLHQTLTVALSVHFYSLRV